MKYEIDQIGISERFQPRSVKMGNPPEDLSGLSDNQVFLIFQDACSRHGELEHKKFISALYGVTYEIPQILVDQVAAYGAEVLKRMQG